MKDYYKNKESSYLQYWDVNNGWTILLKLPVNNFVKIEHSSQFNEGLMRFNDKGYFLEVDFQYLEKLHDLHNDLPFLPEQSKLKKLKIL